MFGNPETTPGGRALKFYASVRLDIRRIETLKTGTDVGRHRVTRQGGQEQGRAAVPRGRVRHHVQRGHQPRGRPAGRWHRAGVLSKTGAWFNYGDTRLGQGRENARDFLKANAEIATKIEDEIRNKVASIDVGVEGISEAE